MGRINVDRSVLSNATDDTENLTDAESETTHNTIMLDKTAGRRTIPFYQSYASFYRAMKVLKENGIPRRVEARSLEPYLKDEAARIVLGFASLEWIDKIGRPSDDLKRLVAAFGGPNWSSVLVDILPKAYPFLPREIEDLTPAQLREAFVAHTGRDADALRTAETFYLCLAAEAGYRLSDIYYRRSVRAISDARRAILDKAEIGDDPEKVSPLLAASSKEKERVAPGDRDQTNRGTSFWESQILNLTSLIEAKDMTDAEKSAMFLLLSYAQRQRSKAKD